MLMEERVLVRALVIISNMLFKFGYVCSNELYNECLKWNISSLYFLVVKMIALLLVFGLKFFSRCKE
jgi:hypothetical protein